MSLDEPSARRPGFLAGPKVRLADGQEWSLPPRDPSAPDPEYDAMLALVAGAEDRADALRAGLALAVFLLTRNYDLPPEALNALLSFPPGGPALADFRRAVEEFARGSISPPARPGVAAPEPPARAGAAARVPSLGTSP